MCPPVNESNNKKRKSANENIRDKSYEQLQTEIETLQAENKTLKEKIDELQNELVTAKRNIKDDETSDDEDEASVSETSNDPWSLMFQQLREYRSIHGDCKVPFKYPSNPKLGFWVGMQRQKNKKKKLYRDRVDKLDSLEFYWGKDFPAPISWAERLEELQKYQKAMGDVPVHPSYPTPLAKWVSQQRKEYKRAKKGAPSLLSLEQIDKLNSVGFNWKGPRLP